MDRDCMDRAMKDVDENGYDTRLCRLCRKLLTRMKRIDEEANYGYHTLEEKVMDVVIKAGDEIGYITDHTEYFRTFMHQDEKTRLKGMITRARELDDQARAVRLTIRIKKLILTERRDSFALRNFGLLKSPADWAGEKFLTLSRDKLREGMMQYTEEPIHSSLTVIQDPVLAKSAPALLGSVQQFMDMKEDKVGEELVNHGLMTPDHRDEIMCQIIKQITGNPNVGSVERGWTLLAACVVTFPPSAGFENYFEVYLEDFAPSKAFAAGLQNVLYLGAKQSFDQKEFLRINELMQTRINEYAESLPQGIPSYADLEEPFVWEDEDIQFKRMAPRPSGHEEQRTDPMTQSFMKKKSPWKEIFDEGSGMIYYWNEVTQESQWEKPADLKYALTTAPGVRI